MGSKNVLKALASDGRIRLDKHARVLRWADAVEAIEVGEGSHLGISLSCVGEIKIAQGCTFQRLFGFPILTSSPDRKYIEKKHAPEHEISGEQNSPKIFSTIPRGSIIKKDLIVKHNLKIEDHCLISGNIKSYSCLVIGDHVTVSGNIFSEEDITIGEHAVIVGNIFSQGRVIIQGNAQIGKKGQMKSIIGKSGVDLGPNICVYGYIMTEGAGMTR
jgi:cytoskeletal protein CcmA (bactofilin family)